MFHQSAILHRALISCLVLGIQVESKSNMATDFLRKFTVQRGGTAPKQIKIIKQ